MNKVINISDEPIQAHHLLIDGVLVDVELRFFEVLQNWIMSVTVDGQSINGIKLACSTLHMQYMNFPFDFVVNVTDTSKADPFRLDDFTTGRCELYVVTADEMEEIRGGSVPPLGS